MKQYDKDGWPNEMTETELRLYHRSAKSLPVAFREACSEIDRLKAENKQLKKFAQHLPDCNLSSPIPQVKNGKKICTCGFEKAMKGE